MSENENYLLGQMNGKLDGLQSLIKDHMEQDTRRFEEVFRQLNEHSGDINKAKGAKNAIMVAAAAVASVVSGGIAFAHKLLH